MTAPIDALIAFVIAGALSLSCRVQLRISPRPWYATRYFLGLATLFGFLVIPSAAYRYFFHPDWSSMYLFDAARLPGVFGMGAIVVVLGSAMGAFVLGNYCARGHREWLLLAALALATAGIALAATFGADRIKVVGSHRQWEGAFGLQPLGETDLFPAVIVMGACVLLGWLHALLIFTREAAAVKNGSR